MHITEMDQFEIMQVIENAHRGTAGLCAQWPALHRPVEFCLSFWCALRLHNLRTQGRIHARQSKGLRGIRPRLGNQRLAERHRHGAIRRADPRQAPTKHATKPMDF